MAASAIAMAAQDGAVLKRTFKEGSSDVYKQVTKIKMIMTMPQGEMNLNTSTDSTYTVKYKKVDPTANTADVDTITKIDKMDMTGSLADMAKSNGQPKATTPKPVTLSGQILANNTFKPEKAEKAEKPVKGAKGGGSIDEIMSMGAAMQSSVLIEFPDKAVKVGDTWDIAVPVTPATPAGQKLAAKLTGEKTVDGIDVWVVNVSGTIKMKFDMSEAVANDPDAQGSLIGGMKMLLEGTVDMTEDVLIEKSTGRTVQLDGTMKTKQNISIADMGISIDGTTAGTVSVKLQK